MAIWLGLGLGLQLGLGLEGGNDGDLAWSVYVNPQVDTVGQGHRVAPEPTWSGSGRGLALGLGLGLVLGS
eukprot:scaffold44189_cov15-Phaeocystis_antarctica.AAC.1